MGVRGELFSTKVQLQNRTYFFNVKENRLGDLYLNVVESKNRDEGGFERQSVILFAEDLQEFLQGFDESLRVMEKAVREKRRGSSRGPNRYAPESDGERAEAPSGFRQSRGGPRKYGADDREEGPRRFRAREGSRSEDGPRPAKRSSRNSAFGENASPHNRDRGESGKARPGYKERDSGGKGPPAPMRKRVVVKKP